MLTGVTSAETSKAVFGKKLRTDHKHTTVALVVDTGILVTMVFVGYGSYAFTETHGGVSLRVCRIVCLAMQVNNTHPSVFESCAWTCNQRLLLRKPS